MAEAASGQISREALGRIARLADLYDAANDKFCGVSIFQEHLPPDSPAITTTDNHHIDSKVEITSSLNEKFNALEVEADLKLSVLAGMIKVEGSAKYLNEKKNSYKSAECALVYKTKTVVEQLQLFHNEVKKRISLDALKHTEATHVVVKIYWGANCTVRVTDDNSEQKKKQEVEVNLKAHVDRLVFKISGEAGVKFTEDEKKAFNKFSSEIFGDILPDSSDKIPTTFENAVEMIRKVPHLIQKSNNGKGKPLTYEMFPLSSPAFRNYLGVSDLEHQTFRKLDEERIEKVIRLYDHILEFTQEARDQLEEMNKYSYCVTAAKHKEARSIVETLQIVESNVRSDLEKVLTTMRLSDNTDSRPLSGLYDKHYNKADETFQKCEKIYNDMLPRIMFAKRCEKFSVKYLTPPVVENIEDVCDDHENVYVFFRVETDPETAKRYRDAIIELAEKKKSNTVCCVVWAEESEDIRIEQYKRRKLLHRDVVEELEAKDIPAAGPALPDHSSSAVEVHEDDQEATVDLPTVEEIRAAAAAGGIEECRRLLERKRDACLLDIKNNAWTNVRLNVAVIGNAGVGKSSFINAIRGLEINDERAAAVGVTETTMEPRSYPHPDNPNMVLWDLPGVGTDQFPRETYLTDIDVDRYDFFLLMTDTRFTENDIWFGEEFRRRNKKYFFVRTKIELEVIKIQQDVSWDKKAHPRSHNEEAVLGRIRESTTKELRKHGFDDVPVFLIDNYEPDKFDFEKLKLLLIENFPELKKSALILSLQANSEQMIRLKVATLRSRIWKLAAISGVAGAIPIPGQSVIADLSIVAGESMFYYRQLGLDDESLRRYADLYPVDYNRLKLMVGGALGITGTGGVTTDAMKEGLLLMLRTTPTLASTSAKIGLKFVPIIGSLIGAPALFGGTYVSLKLVLDKFEQLAIDVMKYLTESVAKRSMSEEAQSAATVLDNVD